MDTCMCMVESLHCSPEATIVSQLYPIQNAFSVKKDKNKKNFLKILKMVQIKKKKKKNYPSCRDDTGSCKRKCSSMVFLASCSEKAMAPQSGVLAWRIQGQGSLVGFRLWGRTESDTTEAT